jgi:glycine dehydrogenase subunit 2
MRSIAEEAATNPELVKTAPHSTRVRRLDEVGAARKPILRWDPARQEAQPEAAGHKKHKHLEPTPVIPTA